MICKNVGIEKRPSRMPFKAPKRPLVGICPLPR
nr:MAG TPA: hypothetical protein [Caudoviricetes sp.]